MLYKLIITIFIAITLITIHCSADSPKVQSALADLDNPDPLIRKKACKAVSELPSNADSFVPQLILLLNDNDSSVRYNAAKALGVIGNSNDAVVSGLIQTLSDPEVDIQRIAKRSLYLIGPKANVLDLLSDAINRPILVMQKNALELLREFGQPSIRIVDTLLSLLASDPGESTVNQIIMVIIAMDSDIPEAIQTLRALLCRNNSSAIFANYALYRLGDEPNIRLDNLLKATESSIIQYKIIAISLLGDVVFKDERVIALLIYYTQSDDIQVKTTAISALGFHGYNNNKIVDQLIVLLEDENDKVRSSAITALGFNVNERNNEYILTHIAKGLYDSSQEVKIMSLLALKYIGQPAGKVLPTLYDLIEKEEYQSIRPQIDGAIRAIEGKDDGGTESYNYPWK